MAGELKARIGPETIGRLAAALTTAEPTFARRDFERRANRGLDELELRRRYVFRPMSTRSYHPGTHVGEVMINGQAGARAEFELKP